MITRKDLTPAQQAVQGIHAAIEISRRGGIAPDTPHPHLVLCHVKHEDALHAQAEKLQSSGIRFEKFYEPDRDNELTALATAPIKGDDRRLFRRLQLVKG